MALAGVKIEVGWRDGVPMGVGVEMAPCLEVPDCIRGGTGVDTREVEVNDCIAGERTVLREGTAIDEAACSRGSLGTLKGRGEASVLPGASFEKWS